eukprot:CAMPEP_0172914244 /NCGR_PEP_ID=MMETSP1075-20121228/191979_1 /TAXON_ID=2916 /ORGANISM="Ceratium fusus, Strain PA161109" /LENGTH=111 /DNA_ID=CAMNT_0013773125 /DNA_START=65 /DNA_END=403 /DNA_ORIENTATION=-
MPTSRSRIAAQIGLCISARMVQGMDANIQSAFSTNIPFFNASEYKPPQITSCNVVRPAMVVEPRCAILTLTPCSDVFDPMTATFFPTKISPLLYAEVCSISLACLTRSVIS